MSDIEFFANLSPKMLTSLDEDCKAERKQYFADEERFRRFGTNSQKLADFMANGQVLPASELVRVRDEQERVAKAFEQAVQSEVSHQRTKTKSVLAPAKTVYSREPFED